MPGILRARRRLRTMQGPSWGCLKSQCSRDLINFWHKFPQNGSTNGAERGWDTPTKGLLWNETVDQTCPFEQPLRRVVKRFRGGLVFKAHRLVYDSTLGSRVRKKKKTCPVTSPSWYKTARSRPHCGKKKQPFLVDRCTSSPIYPAACVWV